MISSVFITKINENLTYFYQIVFYIPYQQKMPINPPRKPPKKAVKKEDLACKVFVKNRAQGSRKVRRTLWEKRKNDRTKKKVMLCMTFVNRRSFFRWYARRDLNPRPSESESDTLSN